MNEAETRAELIDPKLREDGWDSKLNPDMKVHREYLIAIGKLNKMSESGFAGFKDDQDFLRAT